MVAQIVGRPLTHAPGTLGVPAWAADEEARRHASSWLREIAAERQEEDASIATKRHKQLLFWTRVAGIAAIVAILVGAGIGLWQYIAQESRWTVEDDRIAPSVEFKLDTAVTNDGWRHAVLAQYRLPVDLEIDRVEAVSPASLEFADQRADDNKLTGPAGSPPKKVLTVNRTVNPDRPRAQGWGLSFLVRVKGTPNTDHGQELRVRFVMRENDYPNHQWNREYTATIP